MSSKSKFAALAEQARKDNAETPAPVSVAIAALSSPPPALPTPATADKPSAASVGLRDRTTITFTPGAASALRRLQAFLMVEGGAGSIPAAVAVNVALELAAADMPANRTALLRLLDEHRQSDKRRRSEAS